MIVVFVCVFSQSQSAGLLHYADWSSVLLCASGLYAAVLDVKHVLTVFTGVFDRGESLFTLQPSVCGGLEYW